MKLNKRGGTLLLYLLLIFLTRALFFWEGYLHADEALFALSAKVWQHGGVPYVDFFENKSLGVYLFYSLASWFSHPDVSIRAIHLFSMAWTLFTALTVDFIASRTFSRRAGWIAGALFILFSSFWGPDIVAVHIEVVLLLPWCLTLACLLAADASKARFSFLAGASASAAFLCKYQAGILLPVAAVYFWILLPRFFQNAGLRDSLRHSVCFFIGFLPLPAAMVYYLHHAGAWDAFYFWNVAGNVTYIQEGHAGPSLLRQAVLQISRFVASTLLAWVLTALRLGQFWGGGKNLRTERRGREWLLWTWLALTFVPVSVGWRFEDHYFLFLVPALSVLSAAALDALSPGAWRRWRVPIALGLALPTLAFSLTRFFIHDTYARWGGEEMGDYRAYGDHLRERTAAGERIFVWGCAPAVYLYADRLPASRFFRTDTLAGRIAGLLESGNPGLDFRAHIRPGAWPLFLEDMQKHPPSYILDTAPTGLHDFSRWPMSQYLEIMEFLEKNYVREANFQNAIVYRKKN